MKEAKVTLTKKDLLYDVDALTYKRVDATLAGEAQRAQNALSSDSSEDLDGSILNRLISTRLAKIKRKLAFAIKANNQSMVASPTTTLSESIEIPLMVPDNYTQDQLSSLSDMMHDYLVKGTIRDWYKNAGVVSTVDDSELEELESAIVCSLRVGYTRRPMQPFGPRK